jgi:hypothetical protein
MENIANDNFRDRFDEAYEIALSEDYELQDALAFHILDPWDHYLFCKEDAWDLIGDHEELYDKMLETAFDSDGCLDMRELAFKAYGIEIDERK